MSPDFGARKKVVIPGEEEEEDAEVSLMQKIKQDLVDKMNQPLSALSRTDDTCEVADAQAPSFSPFKSSQGSSIAANMIYESVVHISDSIEKTDASHLLEENQILKQQLSQLRQNRQSTSTEDPEYVKIRSLEIKYEQRIQIIERNLLAAQQAN